MTTSPRLDDATLDRLAELAKAATPGPWLRQTEGNASVEQIAHKLLHDLSVPLADGVPASTDATYVLNSQATKTVAFIGNGLRQTDNGDYIAALSPDVAAVLIEAARRERRLATLLRRFAEDEPREADGIGDEEQRWYNHPEWADGEPMLARCTVGDLRRLDALLAAQPAAQEAGE